MELSDKQIDALRNMKNGCILCGGVGSGKSRVSLAYYLFCECGGRIKINGKGEFRKMSSPKDLYIITTAKKRDSKEWNMECITARIYGEDNPFNVNVIVDSWNNIKKYDKVYGAFFIFDEQRVVGSGAWVKAFLKIAKRNHWILLSATPGDSWLDYIPVFVANGFYKNRSEFLNLHAVYNRYSKYPKIDKFFGENILKKHREEILVPMGDNKVTERHDYYISVKYNRDAYLTVLRNRWDIFDDCPIKDASKVVYLLRKVVNSDPSRIGAVLEIINKKHKAIIFYNFTYELEALRKLLDLAQIPYSEWNGEKHEEILEGDAWAYLVQYAAGAEGWNCITTDTIIFFSQTYSYKTLEQASGRIDRLNTPYKDLCYFHLRSAAPIDMAIFRKLKNKQNFNENAFIKRLT